MIQPIERQIDEAILTQIKTFSRKGPLSQPEVAECLEGFSYLKRLCRELDRKKGIGEVPWTTAMDS